MSTTSSSLPDAGITNSGHELYKGTTEHHTTAGAAATHPDNPAGILTETFGRADADSEMYQKDIDERITRIRPMATPVDQISRYAHSQHASSFEVKYYAVGTRPVMTQLTAAVTENATATSVAIEVADPDMFTLDDTIRVVGVKAFNDYRGTAYDRTAADTPDLCLCVCGKTAQGQRLLDHLCEIAYRKRANRPVRRRPCPF